MTLAEGEEEALRETHQAGYPRIELSAEFFARDVRRQTARPAGEIQLSPESVYAGTTMHEAASRRDVDPVGAGVGGVPQAPGNSGDHYEP